MRLDLHFKKYSSPFRLWMGPSLAIFIGDIENAELVLKSKDCINRAKFLTNVLREILQVDGLFSVEGFFFSIKFT